MPCVDGWQRHLQQPGQLFGIKKFELAHVQLPLEQKELATVEFHERWEWAFVVDKVGF